MTLTPLALRDLPGHDRLSSAQVALRAAGLGVVAGGRSTVAPAALAATATSGDRRTGPPLRLLAARRAPVLAATAVAGELVMDKLPSTPSRLAPPVLAGRLLAGGSAGWALAQRHRVPVAVPAVLGVVGALVGSLAGSRWRSTATGAGAPDLVAALVEDAATVGLAWACVRT